ncbi:MULTISPECIES: pilus assembly protein TadG-related protein [Actinoplanes]|uniref:pilus assembly protein TadG-related protein n=1 Tax=Actinoplanes TaxID=1865 RepID=UPI0005F2AEFA|nr:MULTISPECIES: pilus assembly protein TadG-related protein [Actinoplanes]GLY02632.1 hypothetical protein Acsp01_30110 [Actinoplanes sp. NBRC 101535]
MRRLTRLQRLIRWRRPGTDGEHGAISVMVALFATTGILLGMGAVVIDIGLLYNEKEQLQSGADTAVWKVGQACVADTTKCSNALQSANATAYAQKNAADTYADAQVCINGTACPTWNTTSACPPAPVTTGNYDYAEVRTSTRNADNTTLMPPVFAKGLAGNSSYKGSKIGACSRVAWGVPASANVLGLAISKCDWERITGNGSTFYALPGLDPLLQQTGLYSLLGLQPPIDNAVVVNQPILTFCKNSWDKTSSAGYAFLDGVDANCKITIAPPAAGVWMDLNAFNLAAAINCQNALAVARASKQPVLVPIFDKVVGALALLPARYHVVGFAPFVVTGYTGLLSGLVGALSTLGNLVPAVATLLCGLQTCIYGYFTKSLVPEHMPTAFGTSQNFGAMVIGRTG